MKIDLQIHTTFSDGHNTPKEIAELAYNSGVGIVSATEHDNVSSFREMESECSRLGIKAISGVEISTRYDGKVLHILGYNVDVDNQELVSFIENIVNFRKNGFIEQFQILNENLRKGGKGEADSRRYANKPDKYFTTPGLTLFLFEEGIVRTQSEGFDYLEGIKKTVPNINIQDAIDVIHRAGGKAVFSHPFAPKVSLKEITQDRVEQEKIFAEIVSWGLDGLECYGTGQTEEETSFCLNLAEKYNLIITAGSDWHGNLSLLGEHIKKYLPFYLNNFGDLKVPEESVRRTIEGLGIK